MKQSSPVPLRVLVPGTDLTAQCMHAAHIPAEHAHNLARSPAWNAMLKIEAAAKALAFCMLLACGVSTRRLAAAGRCGARTRTLPVVVVRIIFLICQLGFSHQSNEVPGPGADF